MKRCRMGISRLCAVVIAAACLPIPGWSQEKAEKPLPNWKPAPTLLRQLGQEVRRDTYTLRPPKGYLLLPEEYQKSGFDGVLWVGRQRADGTRPGLTLLIATPPSEIKHSLTPEQALDAHLASIRRNRENWFQSDVQRGRVGGREFIRAYWAGTDTRRGFDLRGFVYLTLDGRRIVTISSQDVAPYEKRTLALAEAAALTFRKR